MNCLLTQKSGKVSKISLIYREEKGKIKLVKMDEKIQK